MSAWIEVSIDRPLFAQFLEVAARHPDRPAIEDGPQRWTYRELSERVLGLATALERLSLAKDAPVALDLPYGADFPAAMLACLAVGRPYVALDRSAPEARNLAIAAEAGAGLVIHDGLPAVNWAEVPAISLAKVPADGPTGGQANGPEAGRTAGWAEAGLAYIIYTSGSTGRPKGVYQTQRGLLHDVRQYQQTARIRPDDRLSLLYSPGVNGALRDIYGALLSGACLCIRDLRRHGLAGLDGWIEEAGITIYHSIPNIFRTAVRSPHEMVRWVYLAGDRIFTSDFDRFRQNFPSARLHVGIGATEVATIYRQWVLDGSEVIEGPFLPLGFPVEDREMLLLGSDGSPVASGEVGEIAVRSAFVAEGYWRDPERTAERFVAHGDGTRTYRTGDLGRLRDDGHLELVGRADRQVKVGGTRVELGEVEAVLLACPGVVRAAVIPVAAAVGGHRLVAFVMSRGELSPADVLDFVAERLPAPFVPSEVRVRPDLPVLHNFKTDVATLHAELEASSAAPSEDAAGSVWQAILGSVAADVSWRDGGGDSLGLALLQARLEAKLERPLPPGLMTLDLTLSRLRSWIAEHNTWRPHARRSRVAMFPSLHGVSDNARALIRFLSADVDVHVAGLPTLPSPMPKTWTELWSALRPSYIASLQDVDVLVAHCHGGALAVRLLTELPSLQVKRLILIDPTEPQPSIPDRVVSDNPHDAFAGFLMGTSAARPISAEIALCHTAEFTIYRPYSAFWQARGLQAPPVLLAGTHAEVLAAANHLVIRGLVL
jgi:amino acid adenylation domain-containing protein